MLEFISLVKKKSVLFRFKNFCKNMDKERLVK